MWRAGMAVVTALAVVGGAPGQKPPKADSVVKPKAYVSADIVPRGMGFEVGVVAEIAEGFHINSNKPNEEYLIPTALEAGTPAGMRVTGTTYPKAKQQKFEFSDTKLAVYDGRILVRMKMGVELDAPLGPVKIPLTLKYQACDDSTCLPPVKLALSAEVTVAAAGAKARFVNQEIFKSK